MVREVRPRVPPGGCSDAKIDSEMRGFWTKSSSAINGQRQYLWRAVDQDGDLIDRLVQPRRDGRAARRFFRKLLKSQRQEPCRLVTDKLGSYRVAHRDVMLWVSNSEFGR